MSPWWLRPTAEGAADDERDEVRRDERPEEIEPAQPAPTIPDPPSPPFYAPLPEPSAEPYRAAALPRPVEEPEERDEHEEHEDEEEEEDGEEEEEGEEGEEEDEAEGEAGAEGEAVRVRRRSRSRRGGRGRRKGGRPAAAAAPSAAGAAVEEDDEEEHPRREEPVAFLRREDAPREREIIYAMPERARSQDERKIALFCDFENIALGVRDSDTGKFDILLVLERLLEKGKIIVKKAYADWERYSDYKRPFHEAAIELIDIPQKFYSGKNSADIKMVVDAMDLSYSKEHLDTFVILSGDSDFSPLVSKLKENNKYVIGIGVKNSSSNLLVDNCDEFIYYEDVWRDAKRGPKLDGLNKKTAEAFSLMVESIQALLRENKDVLWGSMIKQTMQRKKPSFNEGYYGYSTFSELLEDAERKNIIKLKKDQRSGTYIVTGFAKR